MLPIRRTRDGARRRPLLVGEHAIGGDHVKRAASYTGLGPPAELSGLFGVQGEVDDEPLSGRARPCRVGKPESVPAPYRHVLQ